MNYAKPEVTILGSAVRVIEQSGPPKSGSPQDAGGTQLTTPAYDLDE